MKSTLLRCVFLAALACGVSTAAAAGDLKLTMQDGLVTIVADNVPLRQILQEWARVGQARIVNADKLSGPAVTLQLINVPERDALDILLRTASGYIAAPRPTIVAGASMYDRITIMAASRAPVAVASAAPPPTFQRPPQPIDESDEPINVTVPPNPMMMQPNQVPQNPAIGPYPGMPTGVQQPAVQSQPGMPTQPMTLPRPGVLPAPQMPNGVPNPYQPTVIRPGGPGGPGGPGDN